MSSRNENTRCKGTTKKGKPCRAAATPGGLCFFHANPNKASELGRIGGRSKGFVAHEAAALPLSSLEHPQFGPRRKGLDCGQPSPPLPLLDDAIAVRDRLEQLIVDVQAGKVHPKVAAAVAHLINLKLRALDTVREFERLERCFILGTWQKACLMAEVHGSI
jgi:hypothetical protein